jgi:hypothetical protein
MTSSPNELLNALVQTTPRQGTNFSGALKATRTLMSQNWDMNRFVISPLQVTDGLLTLLGSQTPRADIFV